MLCEGGAADTPGKRQRLQAGTANANASGVPAAPQSSRGAAACMMEYDYGLRGDALAAAIKAKAAVKSQAAAGPDLYTLTMQRMEALSRWCDKKNELKEARAELAAARAAVPVPGTPPEQQQQQHAAAALPGPADAAASNPLLHAVNTARQRKAAGIPPVVPYLPAAAAHVAAAHGAAADTGAADGARTAGPSQHGRATGTHRAQAGPAQPAEHTAGSDLLRLALNNLQQQHDQHAAARPQAQQQHGGYEQGGDDDDGNNAQQPPQQQPPRQAPAHRATVKRSLLGDSWRQDVYADAMKELEHNSDADLYLALVKVGTHTFILQLSACRCNKSG